MLCRLYAGCLGSAPASVVQASVCEICFDSLITNLTLSVSCCTHYQNEASNEFRTPALPAQRLSPPGYQTMAAAKWTGLWSVEAWAPAAFVESAEEYIQWSDVTG